jgi:hypothetical protein
MIGVLNGIFGHCGPAPWRDTPTVPRWSAQTALKPD